MHSVDRKQEILAVERLGKEIGYGNMMDIASALWAIELDKKIGSDNGAFIPTIPLFICKNERKRCLAHKDFVKKEVIEIKEE
jgi:hypothetical protein